MTRPSQTYKAATDGLSRNMYLYPNVTTNPLTYFFGTVIADFAMDGAVGSAINVKSSWKAASRGAAVHPVRRPRLLMADMASELEAAAVRLRRAGQDDLARELTAAMRRGVAPVPDQIRAGLRPHLPDRYAADLVAGVDIKTITRAGGATTDAMVSVVAQSRAGNRKLKRLDAGVLSHPVYGNREKWSTQQVEPGWFTGPAEDAAPRVRAELERALEDVGRKAAG